MAWTWTCATSPIPPKPSPQLHRLHPRQHRIRGIASARVKETDRVSATCTELTRLGVQVEEHEDGMTIYPCQTFKPANIQTYNDHRMAMAFSLIGLRFDGVTIENPSCVSKTFPNFFEVLGNFAMIHLGLIGYPLGILSRPKFTPPL